MKSNFRTQSVDPQRFCKRCLYRTAPCKCSTQFRLTPGSMLQKSLSAAQQQSPVVNLTKPSEMVRRSRPRGEPSRMSPTPCATPSKRFRIPSLSCWLSLRRSSPLSSGRLSWRCRNLKGRPIASLKPLKQMLRWL